MSLTTENTALLSGKSSNCNGFHDEPSAQQSKQINSYSHYIDILDKPLYNGLAPILAELDFSVGLSLEELLRFIEDPWWQKFRRTLLCTSVLVFWLILITACALAYMKIDQPCSTKFEVVSVSNTTVDGSL